LFFPVPAVNETFDFASGDWEEGGAGAPRVRSGPGAGVGEQLDVLLRAGSSGMELWFAEDGAWGGGAALQAPAFRAISASPPQLLLGVPRFLSLGSIARVQASWNRGVCQREQQQMGDLANSHFVPGFCLGFRLNPWQAQLTSP